MPEEDFSYEEPVSTVPEEDFSYQEPEDNDQEYAQQDAHSRNQFYVGEEDVAIPQPPQKPAPDSSALEQDYSNRFQSPQDYQDYEDHGYTPPVEETPVEETPVEETSVEETPVEETTVEETPVEETPVEETPVEETTVEETTVEETTAEETPVEETPVEETPVEETPVEETPVEETPVEEPPVERPLTSSSFTPPPSFVKSNNPSLDEARAAFLNRTAQNANEEQSNKDTTAMEKANLETEALETTALETEDLEPPTLERADFSTIRFQEGLFIGGSHPEVVENLLLTFAKFTKIDYVFSNNSHGKCSKLCDRLVWGEGDIDRAVEEIRLHLWGSPEDSCVLLIPSYHQFCQVVSQRSLDRLHRILKKQDNKLIVMTGDTPENLAPFGQTDFSRYTLKQTQGIVTNPEVLPELLPYMAKGLSAPTTEVSNSDFLYYYENTWKILYL